MLLDEVVSKHRRELVRAARVALWTSVLWTKTRSKQPQEPDFIAGLTLVSARALFHLWEPVFSKEGLGLNIIAAFTHQSPRVVFQSPHPNGKNGCELGDILFVHIHHDDNGEAYRNALLLQAKKAKNGEGLPHTIGKGEQHQLDLYLKWFEFKLKGKNYHISPAPHLGAQYLWIDNSDIDNGCCPRWFRQYGLYGLLKYLKHGKHGYYCYHCLEVIPLPYVVAFPDKTLRFSSFLDEVLVRLLAGTTGREYGTTMGDHWSRLIEDLLKHLKRRVFNRRKVGVTEGKRVISVYKNSPYYLAVEGDNVAVVMGELRSPFLGIYRKEDVKILEGEPPEPPSESEGRGDTEGGGGISTILIETYSKQG